jgi:hypothetical protein
MVARAKGNVILMNQHRSVLRKTLLWHDKRLNLYNFKHHKQHGHRLSGSNVYRPEHSADLNTRRIMHIVRACIP